MLAFEQSKGIRGKSGFQIFVESLKFDLFWGLMIIINLFTLAAGAAYTPQERPASVNALEMTFTAMFVIEFFMRVSAHGMMTMVSLYGFLDFCLVWVTGVLTIFILEPAGADIPVLRGLAVFRVLRLTRICYELRYIPGVQELWMLVSALISSAFLLLWVTMVGFFVLVFFGMILEDFTGATIAREGRDLGDGILGMKSEALKKSKARPL